MSEQQKTGTGRGRGRGTASRTNAATAAPAIGGGLAAVGEMQAALPPTDPVLAAVAGETEQAEHFDIIPRPANVGSIGENGVVCVNYYELIKKPAQVYFHHVKISLKKTNEKYLGDGVKRTREDNHHIFRMLFNVVGFPKANPADFVYDGENIVIGCQPLSFTGANPKPSFEVKATLLTADREETYIVQFGSKTPKMFTVTNDTEEDSGYTRRVRRPGGRQDDMMDQAYTIRGSQIIDIIMKYRFISPNYDVTHVDAKNSIFLNPAILPAHAPMYPGGAMNLGIGREVWKGFYSATTVCAGSKFWVNLDVSNSAFFKAQLLGNTCYEVLNTPAETWTTENHVRTLTRELKGLKFTTTYAPKERPSSGTASATTVVAPRPRKRVYKITEFVLPGADKASFDIFEFEKEANGSTKRDGTGKANILSKRTTTVQQYYKIEFKIDLQYPQLPLVAVGKEPKEREDGTTGGKKRLLFPIELCEVYPGQRSNKKLTEDQTALMIKNVVAKTAGLRSGEIRSLAERAFGGGSLAGPFDVEVRQQMAETRARILPMPQISYHDPRARLQVRDSAWNNPRGGVVETKRFAYTVLVVGYDQRAYNDNIHRDIGEFFNMMFGPRANLLGMETSSVSANIEPIFPGYALPRAIEKAVAKMDPDPTLPKLVCVVMCKKDTAIYGEVKRTGDIHFGVMTQCILSKNVVPQPQRGGRPSNVPSVQTIDNILLKINMKLEGINWTVGPPAVMGTVTPQLVSRVIGGKDAEDVLVIGLDVIHPSPGETRQKSIAAIVANLDSACTKYWGKVKVQASGREKIIDLQTEFIEMAKAFHKASGKKPNRIIIYRDGISEGMFQTTMDEELSSIRRACSLLPGGKFQPKITYIVVSKGHHLRMFPRNEKEGCGRSGNVFPGTVVDAELVSPTFFDFYLCSHFGIQGCSRPIHYYVLHDTFGHTPDEIQMITYQLCHVFERCTRPVSIPAPVYYADLMCTRARLHTQLLSRDDASSVSSGSRGGGGGAEDAQLNQAMKLHQNIDKRMYFI